MGPRVRRDQLGPVLPQIPPRQRGGDRGDPRNPQPRAYGRQPRCRPRPSSRRGTAAKDGRLRRNAALSPAGGGKGSRRSSAGLPLRAVRTGSLYILIEPMEKEEAMTLRVLAFLGVLIAGGF